MTQIFRLTLRQSLGVWRVVLLLALAALPALIVLALKGFADPDPQHTDAQLASGVVFVAIPIVLPVVMLTIAVPAFGNEIEDRTLYFLMLKPLSRMSVLLGKLLAVLALATPLVVVSGLAAAVVGGNATAEWLLYTAAALALGSVAYGTLFTWAGLMTQRALIFGFIYVFVWEAGLSSFIEGVRYLSVSGYTYTILYEIGGESLDFLEEQVIELPAALVGAAGVTVVFFLLTLRRLRTMDVP